MHLTGVFSKKILLNGGRSKKHPLKGDLSQKVVFVPYLKGIHALIGGPSLT